MKIKFRVWDKTEKCWLTYDDVFIDQEGDVYFIEERNWAYQSYMHKENITEKVEMNQYTGLKDKNGKEIYEGDIYKRYDSIFVVIFDELGFKCKKVYDSWLEKNVYNRNEISLLSKVDSDYCYEVIGNTYESELVQS